MKVAQTLSKPLAPAPCWQGLWSALFFHLQPFRTFSWFRGVVDVPAKLALWDIVSDPCTTSGPDVIDAVFVRQRFPATYSGDWTTTLCWIVMSQV